MLDKNLFLYDLAVVAILKNEGLYLKEWLDYHLLAGVEHFYLYDNDSTDNQAEIVKPYVEAGLVDYFFLPGKVMQVFAYNDAINRFKFLCRYMALIDLDEFIYPKNTTGTITETVDDILSDNPTAAGLSIHWQLFGSNGQKKADYSRGVLERFIRRAEKDFGHFENKNNSPCAYGNIFLKLIANPRRIKKMLIHYAIYFKIFHTVNEKGIKLPETQVTLPICAEKIVINHYFNKSREEAELKIARGRAGSAQKWPSNKINLYDRNEVFDDGILKYRAVRADNFSLADNEQRLNRVKTALIKTLSRFSDGEISDLETALTCQALSHYFLEKFPDDKRFKIFEEASLAAILSSLDRLKIFEIRLLIRELPNFLILPYPIVTELKHAVLKIISQMMQFDREDKFTEEFEDFNHTNLDFLRRLLEVWR